MNYLLTLVCLLLFLVSNSFACSDACTSFGFGSCSLAAAQAACSVSESQGCFPRATCQLLVVECSHASDGAAVADVAYELCDLDSPSDWNCYGGYSPVKYWARLTGPDAEAVNCSPSDDYNPNKPEDDPDGNDSSDEPAFCDFGSVQDMKYFLTTGNAGAVGKSRCDGPCFYIGTNTCYTDGRCLYELADTSNFYDEFVKCRDLSASGSDNVEVNVDIDLSGVESRLDSSNKSLSSIEGDIKSLNGNVSKFFNPDTSQLPAQSAQLQIDVEKKLTESSSFDDLKASFSSFSGDESFVLSDAYQKFKNQLLIPFSVYRLGSGWVCPIKSDYVVNVPYFSQSLILHFDLSIICYFFSIVRIFVLIGFFFKALRIAFA